MHSKTRTRSDDDKKSKTALQIIGVRSAEINAQLLDRSRRRCNWQRWRTNPNAMPNDVLCEGLR